MMKRCLLVLALLVWAALPLEAQELRIQVFQLNNRPALATVDVVRLALSPLGTVVPDERTQSLVVRDTPEALARVQELLTRIDVPAPLVRITVGFSGASGISGMGAGGAWDPATGQIYAGAGAREGSASSSGQQNLLVMSGEEARLVVSRDLVQVQPYWTVARDWGLIPPGVVFRQVSTGFVVQPRVAGQSIVVSVMPWFSYLGPEGRGDVRFTEAASTVRLTDGQTVSLGRTSFQGEASQSLFGLIMGTGSVQRSESGTLTLTARIEPDWSR